ncbi:MAG: signal peptide peptidase SppA [Clostridiales Family XIII bacterium]|jgi:protease-4|nr:signal peptide peptidase SppA [Clostridiales Family XIII bacterium]
MKRKKISMFDDYENKRESHNAARPEYGARPDAGARPNYYERPYAGDRAYTPRDERRGGGLRKGIIIYICIFIGIVLLGFVFRALFSDWSDDAPATPGSPYIARLDVTGTISGSPATDLFGNISGYNHSWTLDSIDDLMYDDNNFGLILFVDSPGGGVYESDELYLKLREYADSTGRPIYAVMGSMAASGGYYISTAAEYIYANRNTWTGSIGVTMGTMVDLSEFLDRYGVKTETITSGRNKAMGSNFEPMTDEQRAIFQGLIDEAYDQFTGIVAEERYLELEYVRELADGRIYTAAQAIDNGLIDDIGDFYTALADMQDIYNLDFCDVATLSYEYRSLFGTLFGAGAEKNLTAVLTKLSNILTNEGGDIGAALRLAESNIPAPQYLYER